MQITLSQVWNGALHGVPQPEPDRVRLNRQREEWMNFNVWCAHNGKKPNRGASVREYVKREEMNNGE